MKKYLVLSIIIIAMLAGCMTLMGKRKEGVSVRAITTQRGDVASIISATGKVTSSREARISAQEPGQILAVHVREGQAVMPGTLLAEIDAREAETRLNNARAALSEASARVRQEERQKASLQQVYKSGGVSLQSVKDSATELEICLEAEKRAMSELKSSEIRLGKLRIISPFKGIITKKDTDAGEWASAGMPLFTIAEPENREIEIFVDEADAGLIKPGQAVELSCDTFPGVIWKEKVMKIDPAVNKEGTASTVRVRVDCGSETPDLKFGQQIDSKIYTSVSPNALKLPFEALITQNGKPFVALAVNEKITFIPVQTGIENTTHIEILKGLNEGDEVLVPESKGFKDGAKVKIVARDSAQ